MNFKNYQKKNIYTIIQKYLLLYIKITIVINVMLMISEKDAYIVIIAIYWGKKNIEKI